MIGQHRPKVHREEPQSSRPHDRVDHIWILSRTISIVSASALVSLFGCRNEGTPLPIPASPPAPAAAPKPVCSPAPDGEAPSDLACTGLYRDVLGGAVADGALPFRPAFEFWSDGATKARWILLPKGSRIDATNMNEWMFPVGTKVWKEFRVRDGERLRRVETRLLWKRGEDEWIRAVYAWARDESTAIELKDGAKNVVGDYSIPKQTTCARCHNGKVDNLLGFEAVQLAAPEAEGLTYGELQKRSWVESKNGTALPAASALSIPGATLDRRALGWLHANCGVSCHQTRPGGSPLRLRLEIDAGSLGTLMDTGVYRTAVNQLATGQATDATQSHRHYRIRPGDPDGSALLRAISVRDNPPPEDSSPSSEVSVRTEQMPPLATRRIDAEGVDLIRRWIESIPPNEGFPAPLR